MRQADNHIGWEVQRHTLLVGWQRWSDVFPTKHDAEEFLVSVPDSLLYEYRIYESVSS